MPIELLAAANAAQPVSRLMSISELFSAVVHFALDVDSPSTSPTGVCTLGAAVVVSHTCTTWRALAIDTPTLWARQIGMLPYAVAEFLARSNDCLVDVHWVAIRYFSWPADTHIDSTRLSTLFWKEDMDTVTNAGEWIRITLSGNLSNLVTLELWHVKWHEIQGANMVDLPRLVQLSLYQVKSAILSVFNIPRLKKLEIRNMVFALSNFLGTLRLTPLLEDLIIFGCLSVAPATGQQSSTTTSQLVELPRLRHLDITCGFIWAPAVSNALYELLDPLHMSPDIYRVLLEGGWTESLLSLCLHHVLTRNAPTCLLLEESIQFYSHLDANPAVLPPKIDKRNPRANLAYPEMSMLAATLSLFGMRADLLNLTSLVMFACTAETYWVLNSALTGGWDEDDDGYECLIRALAPGATSKDDHSQLPFPRLRNLGLGVSSDDTAQLLDIIHQVLTHRADDQAPTPDILSLPLIARPPDDAVAANHLHALASVVHWKDSSEA
ncbi:hypothetical protein PENSPDRAFT_748292 [Peniophora sp. CONT]|nr:hypothetical protein PENSPDRAFT_748292 [Peniophora sp. CONT]